MSEILGVSAGHVCPRCLERERNDRADAKAAAFQNRIGWWLFAALVALAIVTAIVSP